MTISITDHDITVGEIAEDVRKQIGDLLGPAADRKADEGVPVDTISDGFTFGLIAMACVFASTHRTGRRPGCPQVRQTLHVAVDRLLDQLIAYDAGRINQAGETVQ